MAEKNCERIKKPHQKILIFGKVINIFVFRTKKINKSIRQSIKKYGGRNFVGRKFADEILNTILACQDDVTKKRPGIEYIRAPTHTTNELRLFVSLIRLRRIKETKSLRNKDHQGLRRQMCKVCLRSRAKCEVIIFLSYFSPFLLRY